MVLPGRQLRPDKPRSNVSGTATLSTRLPRLSPRLHFLVGCGACASTCAPLARGQKPAGSTQAGEHRRLRLPQPPVLLLWDHRRSHPCLGWGWHAWPCRAHPDLPLSGLPHHVQCSTLHALVPFENPFSPGRHGADHALAEGLDLSAAERVFGYRQATITT